MEKRKIAIVNIAHDLNGMSEIDGVNEFFYVNVPSEDFIFRYATESELQIINIFKGQLGEANSKPEKFKDFIYSIDFGYNHPSCLLKIWHHENEIFVEELIYESYLTTEDIINRFDSLGINKKTVMVADYARPEIIKEIKRKGYNIIDAALGLIGEELKVYERKIKQKN